MQEINHAQGSPEWFAARAGLFTASNFGKVISPTGLKSKQVDAYTSELLAEIMVGGSVNVFEGNAYTDRGNELEPKAADVYAFIHDIEPVECGFTIADEGFYGASPDRLLGEDGLLEIKCPAPHTHIANLLANKVDSKYTPQLQGQLLCTGRKWVDWMSYHPELPPVIIRVERDEDFIIKLKRYLKEGKELLEEKKNQLKQLGYL